MATSNAINANSTGLVRYDGAGNFDAVTTTNHDLLVGAASNGITSVAPSATSGVPVVSQGAAADPIFGTASVAGGGTGAVTLTGVLTGNGTSAITANTVTNHGVLIGGASNAVSSLGVAATGVVLQGVTGSDPAFSTATYPSTATGTGTILRADGTNWVATTATYPTTTTVSEILYSSATNVVGGITTANSSLLKTNGSGVPSMTTTGSVTETSGQFNWPLQPCFLAYNSSSDSGQVKGGFVTVDLDTEVFDQGGNFSGDTFTAPITGKYLFNACICISGINAATRFEGFLTASNRQVTLFRVNPVALVATGSNLVGFSGSAIIDMDAGDTCVLQVVVDGGTSTYTITGSSDVVTYMSGQLIA